MSEPALFDWQLDGSNYTYGERLAHFQKMLGFPEKTMAERVQLEHLPHQLATEEMLTEIHAMLRFLCLDKIGPSE